jgi:uncharacterized oxidoreductase
MKLTGNTVVITGGSSGIGLELAKVLISKQNQVIICGRSLEKLEQAKQAMPSLHIFQCDVSKAPDRVRFAEWVANHFPQMNILINNAAIVHKTNFFSDAGIVDKAEWETQTNFIAPLALTKLFFPIIEQNQSLNHTILSQNRFGISLLVQIEFALELHTLHFRANTLWMANF